MQTDWAAENLQTIRTLMERTAVYRRAMAPLMMALGVIGVAAAAAGFFIGIDTTRNFAGYWMLISIAALAIAFLLIRRQALKDSEPFWSPPTRRVSQAILPPLFAGLIAGLASVVPEAAHALSIWWLVPAWMILYGCSVHAAGFFMPRGFKLFGWGFILSGCIAGFALFVTHSIPPIVQAHWLMGAFFGGAHLAYGVYLHFTETRRNAA
jgi:hypothetical protein